MKRTYISPEFSYRSVYGTYNLEGDGIMFGSVLMVTEKKIDIVDESLTYVQLNTGEQLDEDAELNATQIIYDSASNKLFNHTIKLADGQDSFVKENNAKWEMTIELQDILRNHLFATLKNARTFEGLKSEFTALGDVDQSIFSYINKNLLFKYGFTKIDVFLDYVDLCNDDTLQYKNDFDPTLTATDKKFTSFDQVISPGEKQITLRFNQTKPAYNYSFKYNFNVYFEKL
jgi:hypothetical protein